MIGRTLKIGDTIEAGILGLPINELTLASTEVYDTGLTGLVGHIYIRDKTNTAGSIVSYSDTATIAVNLNAKHTITKDNATTLNVYFDTTSIMIQNLTGAEISIDVFVDGIQL